MFAHEVHYQSDKHSFFAELKRFVEPKYFKLPLTQGDQKSPSPVGNTQFYRNGFALARAAALLSARSWCFSSGHSVRKTTKNLEAEEVCDGADVVREDELSEPDDPGVVTPTVEIELAQKLPNLEGILESCKTTVIFEKNGKSIYVYVCVYTSLSMTRQEQK